MRVTSLSQVRWFLSLLSEQLWRWRSSDKLTVEFRIERVRRFRVYVNGFILEDRCVSLWVVEVVDNVRLITCRRGCFSHRAHSSFCGSAQCLLIGNVTWEVDVEDKEERDEGGPLMCKQEDEDECACDIMGDTWRWNNLFAKTTRSWAIDTHHELCVRWDNCAHTTVLKQTHHELERQTCPSQVEGQTFPSNLKQNKGTGNGIRSLCSRTRWESQIQIPTRSVHQTFRASSHESSSRCAFHISILPTRSHTCLDAHVCLHLTVGYSGSLSTANETCNKDKGHCTKKYCRCTSFKFPAH